MKGILTFLVILIGLSSCHPSRYVNRDNKFAQVYSYAFFGRRQAFLGGVDSVGGLNKDQFENRFRKDKGVLRVIAFMDSCGYELKTMAPRTTGGLFQSSDFSLIFQKRP